MICPNVVLRLALRGVATSYCIITQNLDNRINYFDKNCFLK
nr:MAG TPA: hypothetical protein [Caudoviricetes sp.]